VAPRINDQTDFSARVGQPVVIGVENLGASGVVAIFATERPGTGTTWDAGRGIVLTRVPAAATSGELRVEVNGTPSAPVTFGVDGGAWNPGPFTLGGIVRSGGSPVAGALVLLFTAGENGCGNDLTLHEYDVTDAAGAYGVAHPGGTVFLLVLPPSAGGLALSAQQFDDENANRPNNDVALGAGALLTLRVVAGNPPAPVPNAVVAASGSYLDLRTTGANGMASFRLPAGPVDLEVSGPLGSRLLQAELSTLVPGNLGDLPMVPGVLVTGRVADDDDAPLSGLEVNGFSVTGNQSYFFTFTRDGVWRGPVAEDDPFAVFVESDRDDLADFSLQSDGRSDDLIVYPTGRLDPAGVLSGTVYDAASATPLPGLGVGAFFDVGGFPGGFSGGGQTCDDGSYRIKVPGGAHYVAAFPGFDFPDLLEGFYSPAAPGDFCFDDAQSVVVVEGAETPSLDIELDVRSIIAGEVTVFDAGEPDVAVTATLGRLGSCPATEFTLSDGSYALQVPAATGYRVEALPPSSIGGPPQCFAGHDGCASYDPVTAEPLVATTGIDFLFGFPPPEVSAAFPLLTLDMPEGDDVMLTFEKLPPDAHGDAYNIYSGSLGNYGSATSALCLQVSGALVDNLDGTFSRTVTRPGNGWFLVSASNLIAEGPLGHGRTLANPCGAVPPPDKRAEAIPTFDTPTPAPPRRPSSGPWMQRLRRPGR
jgi:hypothetical protein